MHIIFDWSNIIKELVDSPDVRFGLLVPNTEEIETVCDSYFIVFRLGLALPLLSVNRLYEKRLPLSSHKRMFRRDKPMIDNFRPASSNSFQGLGQISSC